VIASHQLPVLKINLVLEPLSLLVTIVAGQYQLMKMMPLEPCKFSIPQFM